MRYSEVPNSVDRSRVQLVRSFCGLHQIKSVLFPDGPNTKVCVGQIMRRLGICTYTHTYGALSLVQDKRAL